jgi:integrase
MPQKKLTEKTIAGLKAPDPSGRQVMYWDTELKGFAVRVSGTTTDRAYIVQRAINGNTRRITIGPVNVLSLAVAKERALDKLADFYKGIDPKAKKAAGATLGDVLDDYLEKRKDLAPRTCENYRAAIHGHLKPWLNRPLSSVTRDMVERHHIAIAGEIERAQRARAQRDAESWERRAKAAEKRGWLDAAANHRAQAEMAKKRETVSGQVAANNVMKVLRLVWNYAADKHPEIGSNPVRLRKLWYPVEARTRHLRAENMPAFFKATMELESEVARDYVLVLLFCGLRRREAAALRWADVDLQEARVLRIPAAQTKAKRKLDLPLVDFVHDLLVARRATGKTEFVFPANSESGHIEEPKFHFGLISKATGVMVSAHDLRRTYLTVAESCDVSETVRRALVNYALARDVHNKYIQISVERLREPAQKICDKLKQLCGIEGPKGKNVAPLRRRSERN